MNLPRQHRRVALGVVTVLVGLAAWAEACNVPVFRYALERWRPDAYRLCILHDGPLDPASEQLLGSWEALADAAQVNVELRRISVTQPNRESAEPLSAEERALVELVKPPRYPWLVLQYPADYRPDGNFDTHVPLLAGPLESRTLDAWLRSPTRRELTRRLSDGHSAVWLLLESGRADADRQAEAMVRAELKQLAQTLKLPVLGDSPDDTLLANVPLRMEFSLLKLRRDDSAEYPLVTMLLRSEADLAALDEPLVFPIFGRGRALFALVGAGITSENIRGSAEFLSGACSCEVKELNPGFDLLLAHDWNALLSPTAQAMLASTATTRAQGPPELVAIPTGASRDDASAAANSASSATPRSDQLLSGGAAVLMFILVAIGLTLRRT